MNGGSAGSAHIVAGNSGKKKASRRGGNFFAYCSGWLTASGCSKINAGDG